VVGLEPTGSVRKSNLIISYLTKKYIASYDDRFMGY
jgi:hypothetical protein